MIISSEGWTWITGESVNQLSETLIITIRGNNDDVIAVLLKKDKELLDKLDNQVGSFSFF